jgi:hypothetical protein
MSQEVNIWLNLDNSLRERVIAALIENFHFGLGF